MSLFYWFEVKILYISYQKKSLDFVRPINKGHHCTSIKTKYFHTRIVDVALISRKIRLIKLFSLKIILRCRKKIRLVNECFRLERNVFLNDQTCPNNQPKYLLKHKIPLHHEFKIAIKYLAVLAMLIVVTKTFRYALSGLHICKFAIFHNLKVLYWGITFLLETDWILGMSRTLSNKPRRKDYKKKGDPIISWCSPSRIWPTSRSDLAGESGGSLGWG